ncbi:MAG: hypothetical protein K8U57_35480 [Planctomycetes bacterium]|nr:hypothetical protein [Planctomycetota bacterium]
MADPSTELLSNFAQLSPGMQSAVLKLIAAFVAESASAVVSANPVLVPGDTPQERASRFRGLLNSAANKRLRQWKWPPSPSRPIMQIAIVRRLVSDVWQQGWDVVTPTDAGPTITALLAADLAATIRSHIAELRPGTKRRTYLNSVLAANGHGVESEALKKGK